MDRTRNRSRLLPGLVAVLALATFAPTPVTEPHEPVGGTRHRTCRIVVSYIGLPLMGYGRWVRAPIYATVSCGWFQG